MNEMDEKERQRHGKFEWWLDKQQTKKRRVARPGFVVDRSRAIVVARAVAPFLPNLKGMRYEKGRLIPRTAR